MTISPRQKEVPTSLPAARLYLDDIEAIRTTILNARPTPDDSQVDTKFYVGHQVCTDIQELPKIGKRSRNFEMRLAENGPFSARFGVSASATQWTTTGLPSAETWKAFHQAGSHFRTAKDPLEKSLAARSKRTFVRRLRASYAPTG